MRLHSPQQLRQKEHFQICLDDAPELIRIQASRIARLEERSDILQKQLQRHYSEVEYLNYEIQNWQDRCQAVQNHLDGPIKRSEQLDWEKSTLEKDMARLSELIKSGQSEDDQLGKLIKSKTDELETWRTRGDRQDNSETVIMSLENRIKMLQIENERLHALLNGVYVEPRPTGGPSSMIY